MSISRRQIISCLAVLPLTALAAGCAPSDERATTSGNGTSGQVLPPPVVDRTTRVRPGSPEDFAANVGDRVYFPADRYDLTPEAKAVLDRQAAWLKQYPMYSFAIEGHCDEHGTREYNLALGDRRSTSVKRYLVSSGVQEGRIRTLSYGKEKPVALGSNEAAWSQNRRGVTVLAK